MKRIQIVEMPIFLLNDRLGLVAHWDTKYISYRKETRNVKI